MNGWIYLSYFPRIVSCLTHIFGMATASSSSTDFYSPQSNSAVNFINILCVTPFFYRFHHRRMGAAPLISIIIPSWENHNNEIIPWFVCVNRMFCKLLNIYKFMCVYFCEFKIVWSDIDAQKVEKGERESMFWHFNLTRARDGTMAATAIINRMYYFENVLLNSTQY